MAGNICTLRLSSVGRTDMVSTTEVIYAPFDCAQGERVWWRVICNPFVLSEVEFERIA